MARTASPKNTTPEPLAPAEIPTEEPAEVPFDICSAAALLWKRLVNVLEDGWYAYETYAQARSQPAIATPKAVQIREDPEALYLCMTLPGLQAHQLERAEFTRSIIGRDTMATIPTGATLTVPSGMIAHVATPLFFECQGVRSLPTILPPGEHEMNALLYNFMTHNFTIEQSKPILRVYLR